ncbi:MAG: hypothetical protein LUC30_03065 [Clostridiales bacterium]|nr:hypothetical protein [Clostridiales bacterium]
MGEVEVPAGIAALPFQWAEIPAKSKSEGVYHNNTEQRYRQIQDGKFKKGSELQGKWRSFPVDNSGGDG